MKKMFVFDYDGTFYRDSRELIENIKLIDKLRQKGHLFVIATGRSYTSFIKEAEKYKIGYDYLILANGALILDKNDHVIKSYPMDISMVKGVDKLLEPYHAKLESQTYVDDFIDGEMISQLNEVLKMSYIYVRSDVSYDIQQEINLYTKDQFKTYVVQGRIFDYVEIISAKTNKGNAILDLIDYVKADYDVITAGDSENDIEMLIEFDGYLMKAHDPRLDTYRLRETESIRAVIEKELKN